MTLTEWALLGGFVGEAIAIIAVLVKLVAWISSGQARIEAKLEALEEKVENDIAGRRVVAELRTDVAELKGSFAELREAIRARRDPEPPVAEPRA